MLSSDVEARAGLAVVVAAGKPAIAEVSGQPDALAWAEQHRGQVRATVAEHGAVLIRGLGLRDAGQVEQVARRLTTALMAEQEGFAKRRRYADGVYSSSEWSPDQPMCMHNELSYRKEFPGLMLFGCLVEPASGGITGVADSRAVRAALPAELLERFERDGWQLTRNYNSETGVPWAEAFGTSDRAAVGQYCRDNAIDFQWRAGGVLRTRQRRSAVIAHPATGERSWFNQVAFLNKWTLDPVIREYLALEYGDDGLPFDTSFGNGDPISEDVVQTLNTVYEDHTLREPWQAGDLLVVDNVRMAHSRESYEGAREIIVAMGDPVTRAE